MELFSLPWEDGRPSIELMFDTESGLTNCFFEIDTGADVSVLPWSLRDEIIDKSHIGWQLAMSVTGEKILCEKWNIKVKFPIPGLPQKEWIEMEIPFLCEERLGEQSLLGREKVFDKFRITFVKDIFRSGYITLYFSRR
jgi:hypothetical protein